MLNKTTKRLGLAFVTMLFSTLSVYASQPTDWGIGFQEAVTPVMRQIQDFHNLLLYIITGIVVFVTALLAYVLVRFSAKRNKKPSKTSHNTTIEIIWTVVPVCILLVIAIPSFRLLYFMDKTENPELTLKVIGYQWYWGYEYPDHNISFDSYMIPDNEIKEDQVRLLSVDNVVVLPVDTNIQILVTAGDVLHSFAVPAFGIKTDSVPGRLNETWVRIEKEGTYYGQCSELCGQGHAYMPIEIKAVSKDEFNQWLVEAKEKFAQTNQPEMFKQLALAHQN